MKKIFKGWTKFEICFLVLGILIVCCSTCIFKSTWIELSYTILSFLSALLFAKGKYSSYIICIISTFFYAYISYLNGYNGEIIISLGMTLPLCIYGLINWIKNLYDKSTVKIKDMSKKELLVLIGSQFILVFGYYYLLKAFNTNNLIVSTLSLAMSILATYCTARRSENGFWFYLLNDIILITLWSMPIINGNLNIISVLISPCLLLINDCYGIFNWKKLKKIQGGKK